jgi:hypothetical protein
MLLHCGRIVNKKGAKNYNEPILQSDDDKNGPSGLTSDRMEPDRMDIIDGVFDLF